MINYTPPSQRQILLADACVIGLGIAIASDKTSEEIKFNPSLTIADYNFISSDFAVSGYRVTPVAWDGSKIWKLRFDWSANVA